MVDFPAQVEAFWKRKYEDVFSEMNRSARLSGSVRRNGGKSDEEDRVYRRRYLGLPWCAI
ncbi:MAG: hypothetical protein ACLVJ6_05800 [Merdibacter sp.]